MNVLMSSHFYVRIVASRLDLNFPLLLVEQIYQQHHDRFKVEKQKSLSLNNNKPIVCD